MAASSAPWPKRIRWFDYHLKGIDNGIASEPRVKYYQMASARKKEVSSKNGWRSADNWPISALHQILPALRPCAFDAADHRK